LLAVPGTTTAPLDLTAEDRAMLEGGRGEGAGEKSWGCAGRTWISKQGGSPSGKP
jgi:hypothetical protein